MAEDNAIGAFSEEHASRISGVSPSQLRNWDRLGFFVPSFAAADRHSAYSRVYSFRDLVALRVLHQLRNDHRVSLQHLREVARQLSDLGDDWASRTLWVLNKRVVFNDPRTLKKREVVSGQYIIDIPLKVAVEGTRRAIADINQREDQVGHVVRDRFISHYEPVLAGTRIPVAAIKRYAEAGFTVEQIIKEYPDLTIDDVRVALKYEDGNVAA
jgi:uncharacterized protein (DUF433 family)